MSGEILTNIMNFTDEEFFTYIENSLYEIIEKYKHDTIEQSDFLNVLLDEKNNIKTMVKDLQQSKIPEEFINFVLNCLDFGTQSAFWYYNPKNHDSIDYVAMEVYKETSQKYIIAREFLKKLKQDNII